jgi:hypothetical protein
MCHKYTLENESKVAIASAQQDNSPVLSAAAAAADPTALMLTVADESLAATAAPCPTAAASEPMVAPLVSDGRKRSDGPPGPTMTDTEGGSGNDS